LVIITELCQVNSATIIISSGCGGKIELKANGQINAGNITIADVNANFKIVHEEKIDMAFIAKEGITPLFKVQGIKKNWIKNREHTFESFLNAGLSSQTREMSYQKLSTYGKGSATSHNKRYPLRLRLALREIALSGNFGYPYSVICNSSYMAIFYG
jgi:hypothetical protein